MKYTRLTFTALLLLGFSVSIQAKDTFNIKVQIHGIRDTFCLFANHFGDKQYIQDSARCDAQGRFVFKDDKPLREGMYMIVLPSKRFFEIIVDKQKFFSIEADTSFAPENIKFKDSPDNDLFYDYLKFNSKMHKDMEPVQAEYNALPADKKKDSPLKKKIDDYNKQFDDYKNNVLTKYPTSMLASILRATEEVNVPDPPKKPDGSIDSSFQYYYYKQHYFDGIDWSDFRLLRTPIINGKLEYYFSKLVLQIPDSVDKEADWVVNKSEADTEMFKFVTWFITHKYETSNIMGMDAVFVHMVKKYYTKEKAYWLDDAGLLKIQDRAKQLDPILIGKKCRNLVLQDTSGVYQSMYDIKTPYTILFFWDPDCGHCQKSVPKVKEFYAKMKSQGVEIYGVCTETESDKWRKFIFEKELHWINVGDPNFKDNFRWDFDLSTTPQFYILDKNKIIIGKKLDVDQFEDFINHDKKKGVQ